MTRLDDASRQTEQGAFLGQDEVFYHDALAVVWEVRSARYFLQIWNPKV